MQLDLQHAKTVPLLRTPPEGFWSSSYKHATPTGVKPSYAFFHSFGSGWNYTFCAKAVREQCMSLCANGNDNRRDAVY